MPEGFLRLNILLSAMLAIMPLHNGAAVQTILFLSLGGMTHTKIFLKILTKITIQWLCPLMGIISFLLNRYEYPGFRSNTIFLYL